MSDQLIVDVDTTELLAALGAIPDAVLARLKIVSKDTADRIATEARARIRRRTSKTGDAITVEESRRGDGYVIFVGGDRQHIGRFLEFGTKFMTAKPFLFASAQLEESGHDRRARAAIQEAIDELGLGDASG